MSLRSIPVTVVCVLLVVLELANPGFAQDPANPQNFSGLLNKNLVPAAEAGALLGDLLLSRHKGSITGVKVLDDGERNLVVDVTYKDADLTKPKIAVAEVVAENQSQVPVEVSAAPLSARAGTIRLALQLKSGLAEGTTYQARSLVLRIREQSRSVRYDTAAVFSLPKRWSVTVSPQNVVVEVMPSPLGSIPAVDPSIGVAIAPPRIFRPEVREVLVRPVALQPTGPVRMTVPASTIAVHPAAPVTAGTATTASQPVPAGNRNAQGAISAVRMDQMANFKVLRPIGTATGLPPAVTDKGGKGPSSTVYPILSMVRTAPGTQLGANDITSISTNLYRDANPASGIYYYLPARYVLYWDADNGYGLRMVYGASPDPSAAMAVTISARLTSAIDAAEVSLLANLLKAALGDNFKELRPMPFSAAPAFSLRDDLKQFNIPADKISIAAISDIAGDVDLSLTTDSVTKANIEATLTQGLGLGGTATFTAATGGQSFSQSIPVELQITNPHSFGALYWDRGQVLRNNTPFPLRLKYLHFLTIAPDGTPTVYSYSLNNTEVPPIAQARIAVGPVQQWLDGRALKKWVEYGVRSDFPVGIEEARQQWTGGVSNLSVATVAFNTLTPFADPGGIARIIVDIKSKYFDAQGSKEQTNSASLAKDNDKVEFGPLFLINRRTDEVAKAGDPLFSYRFTIVKADGTVVGPGAWKEADRLDVYVGSAQVKQVLEGTTPPGN